MQKPAPSPSDTPPAQEEKPTPGAGAEFMLKTQSAFQGPSEQSRGLPQPPLELPLPENAARFPLPAPQEIDLGHIDLRQAIERRHTIRKYSREPLTLEELSYLLWCTQGVKEVTRRPATLRSVPSAGARHAFETYLLANNVVGLAPGLYRFAALEHQLLPLEASPDLGERITLACFNQQQIRNSAVTFIWVAVTARMRWRYGQRGYRYLHLDAGHVCQNLYLAAEAIHAGVCAIAAYDDERLNRTLGLDGEELFVIYLASLGKRA